MTHEIPTHLDLFSGIGGFAIASAWAGFRTVAFSEIEPYDCAVLQHHWPEVPNLGDIRNVSFERKKTLHSLEVSFGQRRSAGSASQCEQAGWSTLVSHPGIDLLTGGFPCQPASCAGKRRGKADDRWLWPEMLRVIAETKPAWVIAENVVGLASLVEFESALEVDSKRYSRAEMAARSAGVGRVRERIGRGILDQILEDIEALGYEVQPLVIPAVGVDAPHLRYRIWIIAHAKHHAGGAEWRTESREWATKSPSQDSMPGGSGKTVGHSAQFRRHEGQTERPGEDQEPERKCDMRNGIKSEHWNDENENPAGGSTFGNGFAISWQNGPLGRGKTRKKPNGAFVEDVIEAALDRLRYYQKGRFACHHNEFAIYHLEWALTELMTRTAERKIRGVEGTHAA